MGFEDLKPHPFRRFLLRLVMGQRTYDYMVQSVLADRRCFNAKAVDIVVRKDGREKRIEADWIKKLYRIVWTFEDMRRAERALAISEDINGPYDPKKTT